MVYKNKDDKKHICSESSHGNEVERFLSPSLTMKCSTLKSDSYDGNIGKGRSVSFGKTLLPNVFSIGDIYQEESIKALHRRSPDLNPPIQFTKEILSSYLQCIDVQRKGYITEEEFIASVMKNKEGINENNLSELFTLVTKGKRHMTLHDLEKLFYYKYTIGPKAHLLVHIRNYYGCGTCEYILDPEFIGEYKEYIGDCHITIHELEKELEIVTNNYFPKELIDFINAQINSPKIFHSVLSKGNHSYKWEAKSTIEKDAMRRILRVRFILFLLQRLNESAGSLIDNKDTFKNDENMNETILTGDEKSEKQCGADTSYIMSHGIEEGTEKGIAESTTSNGQVIVEREEESVIEGSTIDPPRRTQEDNKSTTEELTHNNVPPCKQKAEHICSFYNSIEKDDIEEVIETVCKAIYTSLSSTLPHMSLDTHSSLNGLSEILELCIDKEKADREHYKIDERVILTQGSSFRHSREQFWCDRLNEYVNSEENLSDNSTLIIKEKSTDNTEKLLYQYFWFSRYSKVQIRLLRPKFSTRIFKDNKLKLRLFSLIEYTFKKHSLYERYRKYFTQQDYFLLYPEQQMALYIHNEKMQQRLDHEISTNYRLQGERRVSNVSSVGQKTTYPDVLIRGQYEEPLKIEALLYNRGEKLKEKEDFKVTPLTTSSRGSVMALRVEDALYRRSLVREPTIFELNDISRFKKKEKMSFKTEKVKVENVDKASVLEEGRKWVNREDALFQEYERCRLQKDKSPCYISEERFVIMKGRDEKKVLVDGGLEEAYWKRKTMEVNREYFSNSVAFEKSYVGLKSNQIDKCRSFGERRV